MIMNQVLNKKQLVVSWLMIALISAMLICAVFTLPKSVIDMKTFFNLYFLITIGGILLLYALRNRKKPQP